MFNEENQVLFTRSEGHWKFDGVESVWKNEAKVANTHNTREREKWKWWQNHANTEQMIKTMKKINKNFFFLKKTKKMTSFLSI